MSDAALGDEVGYPRPASPRLITRRRARGATPALRLRTLPHRRARVAVFGVPVSVDVSWVFGLALATWTFADGALPLAAPGRGLGAYVGAGALAATLLLGSIALHEAGHWVAARRAGLPVTGLALSLVGGRLELGAEPRSAGAECRLALGGPLASLATAAVAIVVHVALVEADADPLAATVPALVAAGNLAVAILNLLPGLPLDGGRVLRALVWAVGGDESRATWVARGAGRVVGATLIVVAVIASASGEAASALWAALLGLTIYQHA
jgi:Zn-dependent protease